MGRPLRSFPVGNYIISYRPIEDGIELISFPYGARNIRGTFQSSA